MGWCRFGRVGVLVALAAFVGCARQLQMSQAAPGLGVEQPARLIRAKGWSFDHEVRVWLPRGYARSSRVYPTLWVSDNNLELAREALSSGELGPGPEVILVSVGGPKSLDPIEFQRRRRYDFLPAKSAMGPDYAAFSEADLGGAPGFLDFLVNQLRPLLAREYRMDPRDHAYAGHSGGAMFGLFALFTRPESFSKYLISSPATSEPWLAMEAAWAREHHDLPARVFLSAGEAEASDSNMAKAQVLSTVALLAERLTLRKFPSLELSVRVFPGKDHLTVMPVAYARGIRFLWGR